jgi:hypothetical protein
MVFHEMVKVKSKRVVSVDDGMKKVRIPCLPIKLIFKEIPKAMP